MMATHQHDALWAKLHELELQLAAYKLVRAARGDDDAGLAFADGAETPGGGGSSSSTCRGRQYDAYMRRRDARRVAASADYHQQKQPANSKAHQPRGVRATPMSPRGALRCAARDTQEAGATATPRLAIAPAKRMSAVSSIASTPRRDGAALPRSRTVSGGATGSPARPSHSHHQRRNSLGVVAEFGEQCATPRPFLRRGTGTGGAAAPARLRTTRRVHDLPAIDVAAAVTPRPLSQQEHAQAAPRHVRSVSELPFDTGALASPSPQQARARKRWGSPERPAAMFSAAAAGDSHRDNLSKGLKKLLTFVTRKGGRSGGGDQAFPAASPRGSGKPVSKGWSGCSHVDVPFDRASLDGHRFPMTRAVGISG